MGSCAGDFNLYGQLGDGSKDDSWTPVQVSGLESGVTAITAGDYHACALLTSGGVKCWGGNDQGQLGDGTTKDKSEPVAVVGLQGPAVAVSAGYQHTCAQTMTGGIECLGRE